MTIIERATIAAALVALSSFTVDDARAGDFRIGIGVRTNSADDLSWLRRHESYADRYNRYSAYRYSYPRYGYGPRYYTSRFYGSSYYRFSPYRYYYRPSYTLPYDPYRSRYRSDAYRSPRIFIGSPYYFSYSLDGYYFGRAGTGIGYGSRLDIDRRVVPPHDCCARPYYCYYFGVVPSRRYSPSPAPVLPQAPPEIAPTPLPADQTPQPQLELPQPPEQPQPLPNELPKLSIPPAGSSNSATEGPSA